MIPGMLSAGAQTLPGPQLRKLLKQAIANSNSFSNKYTAQVWLMDMSNRLQRYIKNPKVRLDFLNLVHHEAMRARLNPELILALIHVESNFDRFAISRVGARGLMQVMPFWIREIGAHNDNLFDPQTNLRYGCTILQHYITKEKGNLSRALARYNGSLKSNKYPRLVFGKLRRYWDTR